MKAELSNHGHDNSRQRRRTVPKRVTAILAGTCLFLLYASYRHWHHHHHSHHHDPHRAALKAKCSALRTPAGPSPSFLDEYHSRRIEQGSERIDASSSDSTLIQNAKILTGARNGTEMVFGDILFRKGVIVAIGYIPSQLVDEAQTVINAKGKWISPGIVDLHSHLGVDSAPVLVGASDGNSWHTPINPWLRSVDGLNTHDDAYQLSIAGGLTSVQVLPGSANNIGGQAVVIKLRKPSDNSVSSRILEAPGTMFVNSSASSHAEFVHWRHMKHACGENPSRIYGNTRLDSAWAFRSAYEEARKLKQAQDSFCTLVENDDWEGVDTYSFSGSKAGAFPDDLKWEALVDVLRGKVKLSIHCYEAVDLDMISRLSNEFKFPVASFHHAGETYLVPDVLKRVYGGAPTVALFASNARKKREAYRGSEFAASILAQHHIPVVMKSDHPVTNSRYLMYEAQLAHFYGLHPGLAIASVTANPARAAGLDHRIGILAPGYDADIVVWDSHPLTLGATPTQVYIDGIPQLDLPHLLVKPDIFQDVPKVPDWDKERNDTIKWDGLPPLDAKPVHSSTIFAGRTKFLNVQSVHLNCGQDIETLFDSVAGPTNFTVIFENGKLKSFSPSTSKSPTNEDVDTLVDLEGGSIAPGLTSFGSPLGLVEIRLEPSTNDGPVFDQFGKVPKIVGGTPIKAVDGLAFGGRNALLAYRAGVTSAITAPLGNGFTRGLATAFSLGAKNALEKGAVIQDITALHVAISLRFKPSVSSQISGLRTLLFGNANVKDGVDWVKVRSSEIPLVVHVESADVMATLIALKKEYESKHGSLRMTFAGATESHLLAQEISDAGISVVLYPIRPYPSTWESKRILSGPPITQKSALMVLLEHQVNVGVGVVDEYDARNLRFDLAWAALEANQTLSRERAIALVSTNLQSALGLDRPTHLHSEELVAYRGGDMFSFESKVVGVISARIKGGEELF